MARMSFQEAARELEISEGELEKLVAAGEIASIKEGDSLFFKSEVISSYKSQRSGEPEIILSDEELDLLEDGDEVDFGIELAGGPEVETPAAASSKGAGAMSAVDDLAEIDLGGDDDLAGGDDTVLSLDSVLDDESEATTPIPLGGGKAGLLGEGSDLGDDTLLDTDILDLGEDDADTFELDTTEDTLLDVTEEGTLLRAGGARVMQMKRRKSHAGWTGLLAATFLVMLLPLSAVMSTVYIDSVKIGALLEDEGRAQHQWIEEYSGVFRGAIFWIADLFH